MTDFWARLRTDLFGAWLLVVLFGKLAFRNLTRSSGAAFGLLILLSIGFSGLQKLAGATRFLPEGSEQVALFSLCGVPLLLAAFSGRSAATDTARLFPFPLTPTSIAPALAVSAWLDPIAWLALAPLLRGMRVGGAAFLVAALAQSLCFALVSAAISTVSARFSRSRIWRERAAWLFPLIAACVVVLAFRSPAEARSMKSSTPKASAVASREFPAWTTLTPPGFASRLADGLANRAPVSVATGVLGLGLWTALVGFVAVKSAKHAAPDSEPRRARRPNRRRAPLFPRVSHAPIPLVVARNELRLLLREPHFRGSLSHTSVALILVAGIALQPTNGPISWQPTVAIGGATYLLIQIVQLLANPWGTESASGGLLFSFPGARAKILAGKNLAHGLAVFAICAPVSVVVARLGDAPFSLCLSIVETVALSILWLASLGNIFGALRPVALLPRGARPAPAESSGESFLTGLLQLALAAVALALAQTHALIAVAAYAATLPLAAHLARLREIPLRDSLT